MNHKVRRQLARRKRRIARRLERQHLQNCSKPVMTAGNVQFEVAERATGTTCGGIAAIHTLVRELKLDQAIDQRLQLLKQHLPYHESDHVLSLAYNALCGGTCLEDLELRRHDEAFLNALGARRIPDPTTAGDFCRRFSLGHIDVLQDVYNEVRTRVWARQSPEFFQRATIDMDGTLVATSGECKQGMDVAYNGTWGFHPLVVSLAETGEVLRIVNRSGNRPSHEGAAAEADRAIALCFSAGFQSVLLRGDTDFSQTEHLDRWHANPRVKFIFGYDSYAGLQMTADDLPLKAWKTLQRPARYEVQTQPRRRPANVKQPIVEERGYTDQRLVSEGVAEFDYRPVACRTTYRMIVIRKNLRVCKQQRLFDDYRYFFYLTNDRTSTPEQIVFSANDRCDQENLHAQLKGGVHALTAPVDNLTSNGAYMAMTALAWNLKAWYALLLPRGSGRHAKTRRDERRTVRRMEFKTFVNHFIRIPCQVFRTGRRIVCRLLGWNPWLGVFFRFLDDRISARAALPRRH